MAVNNSLIAQVPTSYWNQFSRNATPLSTIVPLSAYVKHPLTTLTAFAYTLGFAQALLVPLCILATGEHIFHKINCNLAKRQINKLQSRLARLSLSKTVIAQKTSEVAQQQLYKQIVRYYNAKKNQETYYGSLGLHAISAVPIFGGLVGMSVANEMGYHSLKSLKV